MTHFNAEIAYEYIVDTCGLKGVIGMVPNEFRKYFRFQECFDAEIGHGFIARVNDLDKPLAFQRGRVFAFELGFQEALKIYLETLMNYEKDKGRLPDFL